MHEYSLARTLLHEVEKIVRRERAADARRVVVTIGEFSGVDPDLLEMAFKDVCEQSSHVNTELSIERVALEARCQSCSNDFLVERFRFVCPLCDSGSVEIIRGEEMILERVVLEATR